MSEQISRAFRGSISVLVFSALAAGGVTFGYLVARSRDAASPASQIDAKHAPADAERTVGLLAHLEPAAR